MQLLIRLFFAGINFIASVIDDPRAKKGLVSVRLANKTKMVRRAGTFDWFVIWEVWKLHEYDIPGFEINPTDTVVDMGAQIGSFSVYASKKASKGKVYAYEPFWGSYKLLATNKKINKLNNLKVFNMAVSGKSGKGNLFFSSFNTAAHSMIQNEWVNTKTKKSIKTISLTDIFRKNRLTKIDYLKMDIEGSEYGVILRTPKEVLKKVGKIVMEYHIPADVKNRPKELKNYLKKNGFKVKERRLPFTAGLGYFYATRV